MATIALNNSNNLILLESRIPSVSLEDYNKLKSKYEKKQKENKILKENLDCIMNSYETISQSKKTAESIFKTMKNLIETNKTFNNNNNTNNNKSKEEFSTTYSHCEYLGIADMKTSARSCNCSSSTLNVNLKEYLNPSLIKKVEEMENAYNEILKNFDFMAAKYKIIKQEKEKFEECNLTLIDQISCLTEEYNRLYRELAEANVTIERFKEIDKCLVDSTINSLFLNTNEKRPLNKNADNSDNSRKSNKDNESDGKMFCNYVLCEPVPSFIKFINKFTK